MTAPATARTPRRTPAERARDLALVATFAALIAACSLTSVAFSAVPVPITLQTFAVLLAGAVLAPFVPRPGRWVVLPLVMAYACGLVIVGCR